MKFVSIILMLIVSKISLSQNGTLSGVIKNYDSYNFYNVSLKNLENDSMKSTFPDDKGSYKFKNLENGIYDITFTAVEVSDTIVKNIKISNNNIIVNITMPRCKYNNEKKRCPKCNKKDEIIPILYGYPIGEIDIEKVYLGGCVVTGCDPQKFCKRDQFKF